MSLTMWRVHAPLDAEFAWSLWRSMAAGALSFGREPWNALGVAWAVAAAGGVLALGRTRRSSLGLVILLVPLILYLAYWFAADYPGFPRLFLPWAAAIPLLAAVGACALTDRKPALRPALFAAAALLVAAQGWACFATYRAYLDIRRFGPDVYAESQRTGLAVFTTSHTNELMSYRLSSYTWQWEWRRQPLTTAKPFLMCLTREEEADFVEKFGARARRVPVESRHFVLYSFTP
jgi:hypothetical protein